MPASSNKATRGPTMQNALKKFEEWGIRRRSERNRRNAERRRRLASTLGIEDADAALDLSTLQMGEMVGQGGFSIVYLCRLVDGRDAVAKVIKGGLSPSDTLLLRNEIAIWSRLSHPNLLSFIGTALGTDTCAIICEYCSGGSLYERHRQNLQLGKPPLGRDALVGQLVQVARGMEYLHSLRPHPVLHRDLKSHNILVAHDGRLVVADFGLARFHVTANAAEMTAETGSYRWMAPEVIRHEPYDERCDVYSFGVLGWEMVTYSIPFLHQTPVQAAIGVARDSLRPPLPEHTPEDVKAILESCWHRQPGERPDFSTLVSKLAPPSRRPSFSSSLDSLFGKGSRSPPRPQVPPFRLLGLSRSPSRSRNTSKSGSRNGSRSPSPQSSPSPPAGPWLVPNRSPPPLDEEAATLCDASGAPTHSASAPSGLDEMGAGGAMGRSLMRACSIGGSLDEQNSLAQPRQVLRVSMNGLGGAPSAEPSP